MPTERRIVASVDELEEDENFETWCPECMTKPDVYPTVAIVKSKCVECVECAEGYPE